ncbi:MAG TPA: DoxX family protein [Turneriella sp.]|nr:DoxX family protein [Turneriella sp.]HNJ65785.1 DoxX family protein [Turneriella sp.]HNL09715.1 DoxX family protein [Turneriella sp.]HNL54773.1 DoxX family protein [Turneriella sp.]HNN01172.1 DoxX family protein [Turneriella sp.]
MTQLIQTIAATQAEWTGLVLRLALAAMILPHGAQKLLGWFGGYGFKGTMGYFTGTAGLPAILAFLVIIGEFFGGLMLLAGFGTRIGALWVGVIMLSAMFMVHWQNGFFMNWYGAQKGEGIEFFILAIGIAAALVISGGGHFSVDALIAG